LQHALVGRRDRDDAVELVAMPGKEAGDGLDDGTCRVFVGVAFQPVQQLGNRRRTVSNCMWPNSLYPIGVLLVV